MLSAGSARRLGIGTALLLLVAVCSCGGDEKDVSEQGLLGFLVCPSPFTACNDVCVDLAVNPLNCGACGLRCPSGTRCSSGGCVAIAFGPDNCPGSFCSVPCPPGTTLHEGVCLQAAPRGGVDTCAGVACPNPCPAGTVLRNGVCVRDGVPSGGTFSGINTCTGLGCFNGCPPGTALHNGVCVSTSCPRGFFACADGCQDLRSSALNCGTCGQACPTNTTCVRGTCQ